MGTALSPPILPDPAAGVSLEPSGRPAGRTALVLAGAVTIAVLLLLILGSVGKSAVSELFRPVQLNSIGAAGALLLAGFLALVIHEAGHLIAAVCCRFEIHTVSLGAIWFTRTHSGWRVGTRRKRVFTGSVAAVPCSNEYWRARMLVVTAAGPLATFVGALAAAAILRAHALPGELVSFFLRDFGQISAIIFLLGLVPGSPKARAQNDAALFINLWLDGKEANEIFLYHLVLQHQKKGLEPREFPLWLIGLMATFRGRADFMVLYAGMIASWAFDRGDCASGNLWDGSALALSAHASVATKHACLANSACFDLVFRQDIAAAREKLTTIEMKTLVSPSLRHRALAARDLAFGRITRSLAEVAAARAFLPPNMQSRGFECFFLSRLHASAISSR